ncbi:MAG TPA: PDZ domain-containing protein, partial [Planctomycetota bacterium]|nr:PDZ domain-containing protein [Planctomycetota bacterium]
MSQTSYRQVWLAYAMGISSGILGTLVYRELAGASLEPDVAQYEQVRNFVAQTYVKRLDAEEILTRSLRGLTRSLDPYSRYYNTEESNKLELETAGNYPGIGVVLRRMNDRQRVLFSMAGSPASLAGLEPGDEIVSVEGVPAAGLSWSEFSDRMRGPAGSEVQLTVAKLLGEVVELRVERALVVDPSVRHAVLLPDAQAIGYISVHSFSRRTPQEFDEALEKLTAQGMQGLIAAQVEDQAFGVLRHELIES